MLGRRRVRVRGIKDLFARDMAKEAEKLATKEVFKKRSRISPMVEEENYTHGI
jgi:hypothetical protein